MVKKSDKRARADCSYVFLCATWISWKKRSRTEWCTDLFSSVACGGCWCFRPFGQTLRFRLMPETVCHATYVVSRQRWVHGEGGSIATHHTDWRHGDQQWKQGCKRRSNISSEDLKWSNALGEFLVRLKRILSHAPVQCDHHLLTFHVANSTLWHWRNNATIKY